MRPTSAASTIRALIATVPEQTLRELIAELVAALLRCVAASPGSPEVAASPSNGRRRRHWSRARRAAENTRRRERRRAAPRRRSRKPRVDASGNGSEPTANGRFAVSPAALWEHAAKLEPKAPWRAIVRELGVAEAAAQAAQRDGILPCTPRAAARFMTL
jgi:hypothetical protein